MATAFPKLAAVTMLSMAPTKRGDRQHAPRTGPRIRRGTAPALLLAAAQELFAERGPYATTTRQIADRAEVSEDLIFRYYGSKNGLLQEAVVRPIVELLDSVRPQWEKAQDTWTGDDHERSVAFVGQLYDLVHGNRTVVMTMMQVLIGGPGEIDDLAVHQLASQMYEPLAPVFTKYLERNGFRDTDPALLLRLIMLLIGSSAAFLPGTYPDGNPVPDRDRTIDELATFIHYGLRRPR
jgi:AcrR family transcriptional regulator